ncbi:hypothetical protein [Acinetobacter johnsonii]|uniref:hypothetical protein n=1 Tax=Acinetobacter johnsonii TaxID=40214 RepID=UPI0032B34552
MAGVRLEFAQFGHFDYFNIYRNSASTAIENLGEPIGSSSTMYYEDLTVESNQDYYYRAGVVRNSIEEFSGEFHIKTVVEFDAPYNLIVVFENDETNRLKINWKLDDFVDEQRYYCSETPIDPENLPTPKAVLAGDVRTYVDTAIEVGKTYYICVGAKKNNVEKLSGIIRKDATAYAIDMKVEAGLWVNKGSVPVVINWTGVPTYENDAIVLSGGQWFDIASSQVFNFGSSDFEVTFEIMQTNNSDFRLLLSAMAFETGDKFAQYGFNAGRIYLGESWGGMGSQLISSAAMTINEWHDVKLKRTQTSISMLIDDAVVASKTIDANVTFNFNFNNGGTRIFNITWGGASTPFIGKCRRFSVKRS